MAGRSKLTTKKPTRRAGKSRKIASRIKQRKLRDHLSHLTLRQAEKLLGADGKNLLREGGKFEIGEPGEQIQLSDEHFLLYHPDGDAKVGIRLHDARPDQLQVACTVCGETPCLHQATALAFILEEKMLLGLAAPPPERIPIEALSEEQLVAQAIADREERAANEKMRVQALDATTPWTDYTVTSRLSGKSYRVALRGWQTGEQYCTCPDFRKNTLGLCKHTIQVSSKTRKKFPAKVRNTPWQPDRFAVALCYGQDLKVRLEGPDLGRTKAATVAKKFLDRELDTPAQFRQLLKCVRELENLGEDVTIYPDAEEYLSRLLDRDGAVARMEKIRENPADHPLRESLLDGATLLPYQLDGIAFATAAGRAILADDMGLGKTIQGIGVAEMLRREAGISRVLIICPASLKSQWAAEIEKFCGTLPGHDCQLILGSSDQRSEQYRHGAFFTVCNYEQVLRDQIVIEPVPWDLIILDEGQRIKNWQAKTSNVIKSLRSPYALVLSGTPLENRLDDLYSVVEFIDDRRLGAAFRFYNQHRMVDDRGKVLGYKNLSDLRKRLRPVLLRRTRASVLQDLPPRSTEIVRIAPTEEQANYCADQMQIVRSIVNKRYINEIDLLRLQKALLMARMAADSTYLVHKDSDLAFSSKLERLAELLESLAAEDDRKIVLFSEWTTMLDLIEPLLERNGLKFVRLDGSVPQKKRQPLVAEFRENADCRVFITTNAGSTGLNLQAANTVINVDLPWNPAILEQRIARAHRMGQKRPVQVYILVTEETIEANMLETLSAKHELAQAAIDPDSDIDVVDMVSGMDELKRRLEVLLGEAPAAPIDESQHDRVGQEAAALAERKEKVAAAGGELLSAAFAFLGEVLPQPVSENDTDLDRDRRAQETAAKSIRDSLGECLEKGEDGKTRLTVTLPDGNAIDQLAQALAKLTGLGR